MSPSFAMYVILTNCATEASQKKKEAQIAHIRITVIIVQAIYLKGSYISLLTNSMNYNSTSNISKCMNYISGMVVKMGFALLREALAVNY